MKNLKRYFKRNYVKFILLIFIYPYLVGYSPIDSSYSKTTVDFLIGTGQHSYASYDCNGNLIELRKHTTVDYGASVKYEYKNLQVGLRGGGYSLKLKEVESNYDENYYYYYRTPINYDSLYPNKRVYYVNPFVGFGNQFIEFNVGLIIFKNLSFYGNVTDYLIGNNDINPTWYVRIGNFEKFHFTGQYLSNTPLFSGGGMIDAGFAFPMQGTRNLTWLGVSYGPYQNLGLLLKQNIQLNKYVDLLIRGRGGLLESSFEGGISAGLRLMFWSILEEITLFLI